MKELTPVQVTYLQERGFQIHERKPDQGSAFPYLTLGPVGNALPDSEIKYHYAANQQDITLDVCHPAHKPVDQLVDIIESMVGSVMVLDGKSFKTTPGTPIPIYILDPAWNDVARALERKYKE